MRVGLIAHYCDKSCGYGIARYSFEIYHGLLSKGIDVNCIKSPYVFPSPSKSAFDFFFYVPLASLVSFPTPDIFHITLQQIGLPIPLLKKIRKRKVVTTIHDINSILFSPQNTPSLLKKAISMSAKYSDLILADSLQTKEDIVKTYDIEPDNVIHVPLGVSDKFMPTKNITSDIFTVGYVGSFSEHKGVPFLLRSYSLFEKKSKIPSRLVLYGKGPQYNKCVELAKKLGIKNIEFRGFANEQDLVTIYNSFDVFVFPSEWEGFGLPILEAQKCGVPVIVRENAHISKELTQFCQKTKDEEHLASLMHDLSKKPMKFTSDHAKYLKQFTWKNCINKTLEAYELCLSL